MLRPIKPTITIADLEKLDIRVGTIQAVSDLEDSDELVQMLVTFGDFERRIVVGMKQERSNPKDVEGKQSLFVLNLEPRKIRGVLSEGMLFDIGYADGITPVLAMPEKPVPNGTRVG
jgi:tRNA-binding protein